MTVLDWLKWTQLVLAIAIAITIGVVFSPSVEVIVLFPLYSLYVIWSARSINNHRVSMWLACATSLTVAVLLCTFLVPSGFLALQAQDTSMITPPPAVLSANGELKVIDNLPTDVQPVLQRQRTSENLKQRLAVMWLLLLAFAAFVVVLMHALQWRWLVSGRSIQI